MITLQEYIEKCQSLIDENPDWADFPVIYALDDEGNAYSKVVFDPTPMVVKDISARYLEVLEDDNVKHPEKINAICIN